MNETLSFDGNLVHYRLAGNGKPLIFLHGFLENASIWESVEKELLPFHQLLLIDLPGHGASTSSSEQSMAHMARIVHLICLKEKIENPIVFGHSMGGYVALELAKIFKTDIALVHSNFWEDSNEKRIDRNRVIKIIESNLPLFVNTVIPNLFFEENYLNCKTQIDDLISKASVLDPKAIISVTAGMRDRLNNSEVMEQCNVAVVQGVNDPVFTKEMMIQKLEKLSKKPIYIEINNCGHMGFIEQTSEFLEALKLIINKFLRLNTIN